MSKNYYIIIPILIILILAAAFFYNSSPEKEGPVIQIAAVDALTDENSLFQVSTINALSNGSFDGIMPFRELQKHGDVGLGTVDSLDGEMIEVNNTFYQVKSNGSVYVLDNSTKTPFALVTFFKANETLFVNTTLNSTQMEQYLNGSMHSKNIFYAIEIHGTFKHIKARSVPKQSKPYPELADAIKNQTVFEFNNISGTMIGFWSPESANGIDPPGYHFHFISDDKKSGGHVLDYESQDVTVGIDPLSKFKLVLPENQGFLTF